MPDELNAQLLRLFADNQRPLADAQFLAQVTRRLHAGRGAWDARRVLGSIVGTIVAGLATGVSAPLRLRHAGLMAAAAAAVSLWATLA